MANRNPRAGGRPKIDWIAAFALFASDPSASFSDVARTFGVSTQAVKNHARPGADYPEGWEQRRQTMLDAVRAKAENGSLRTLEERQARTIAVAERLRDLALDKQAEIDAKTAVTALPAYAKLEQLFAGEPTDAITYPQFTGFLRRLEAELVRRLPSELHDVVPAALEAAAEEANAA